MILIARVGWVEGMFEKAYLAPPLAGPFTTKRKAATQTLSMKVPLEWIARVLTGTVGCFERVVFVRRFCASSVFICVSANSIFVAFVVFFFFSGGVF